MQYRSVDDHQCAKNGEGVVAGNKRGTRSTTVTVKNPIELSETDVKILLLLSIPNQSFTQNDLVKHKAGSKSNISRRLRILLKKGLIEKIQDGYVHVHRLTIAGGDVAQRCSLIVRGYEGRRERVFVDRAHNLKAYCEFEKAPTGKILRWRQIPMRHWIKYDKHIQNVYVWYAEGTEEKKIYYQLPIIFAESVEKAYEEAFEIIRKVNSYLEKEGFEFTNKPEIYQKDIVVTDSHHAIYKHPFAQWMKEQHTSYHDDIMDIDSSFKNVAEVDAIDHPQNTLDWTKEVQFIEEVMRGEIRGEDLKRMPDVQKHIATKLEEMDKNIRVMYDQFGRSITGTTEFVRLVPQILAGLSNLTRAVTDQDKNREKIRELEEKLETLEKKEEFSPFEQALINIIKQGNFKKYEIIERVKSLKEFSRLPRRRLKREVFAALESLQQKGVTTKSKNRYRVGRI